MKTKRNQNAKAKREAQRETYTDAEGRRGQSWSGGFVMWQWVTSQSPGQWQWQSALRIISTSDMKHDKPAARQNTRWSERDGYFVCAGVRQGQRQGEQRTDGRQEEEEPKGQEGSAAGPKREPVTRSNQDY